MSTFLLSFDATTTISGITPPTLEVLIGGTPVSFVTMEAGANSYDVFVEFAGDTPSSVTLRFDGSSGSALDNIAFTNVSINNSSLTLATDLTATLLMQAQTAGVTAAASLFGYTTPTLDPATVTGTAGDDDTVRGTNAADSIDGLGGADRLLGQGGDDHINGGAGDDYIFGEAGADTILGGAGNDVLFGNDGDDVLHGEADNDFIIGGAGDDIMNGGAGNDGLYGGDDDDVMFGEDGDDILIGQAGDDVIIGDAGNDTLVGEDGNDRLAGGDNDDFMDGGDGSDLLNGGSGNDEIHAGAGDDIVVGGAGNDKIFGWDGQDLLAGDAGNDTIHGGDGNDEIYGGDNDDVLIGGAGIDTIYGGADADIIHGHGLDATEISAILFNNPGVVYSEATGSFYQYVTSAQTWDNANNAAQTTTLNGNSGHLLTISSQAENDFIEDLISGNIWLAANDTANEGEWLWTSGLEGGMQFWSGLAAGSSVNNMYENWNGGEPNEFNTGEDYAEFRSSDGLWNDNGGPSNAALTNGYVIEWEAGLMSDDGAADILSGDSGNDIIFGYDGDDTLNGNNDDDILVGGAGSDTLNGGIGNDALYAFDGTAVDANQLAGGSSSGGGGSSGGYTVADALAENPNVVYNATTGNFYQLVSSTVDWTVADAAAQASTLNGVSGHLGTITSAAEQSIFEGLASGVSTWLGGSDAGTEGVWQWVTGPESGTQFSDALGNSVGGMYTNWTTGQPNDSDGTQDYLYLLNGTQWADLVVEGDGSTGFVNVDQYIIEWEGSDVLTSAGGATITVLEENFTADDGGFTYADDVFGSALLSALYADGTRITTDGDATAAGALQITLGGIDDTDISDMSGAWQQTVTVSEDITSVSLSFSYRVLDSVVDGDPFDAGEDTQLFVDIDGTTYSNDANSYFFEILGTDAGASFDSGWQQVVLSVGNLSAGTYDLSLGALLTDKTWNSEQMQIRFDDILLEGNVPTPGSGGTAGSNPGADDGETNILNGGDGNDTLYGGGGMDMLLGDAGVDTIFSGSNETIGDAINSILAANAGVVYSAATNSFYQYVATSTSFAAADAAASSSTLTGLSSVNGHLITVTSQAENDFIDSIIGGAVWLGATDTAVEGVWRWVTGPESGIQFSNGGGTSVNSQYENWSGGQPNNAAGGQDTAEFRTNGTWTDTNNNRQYVIEWEADSLLSTVDITTLNGGTGNDVLYGNSGIDIFVFDAITSQDTIFNFDASGRDQLDFSSILTSYDPLTDDITDFIQLTEAGGNTTLAVDTNGSAGGSSYTAITTLDSVTGLDLYQMVAADNLIL